MINVLLIGSGGREHAIALRISESKSLGKLFISPGNPGTKSLGENINLDTKDRVELLHFCENQKIDLIVIGPEQPIVEGLGDLLRSQGYIVFAPDAKAAEIEAHKSFAKEFMVKNGIPTASYIEFNSQMYEQAKRYIERIKYPCVIKADGIAAGKGVLICNDSKEAVKALDEIFLKKAFGDSGNKIVIEEFLVGDEASIFAITDGEDFICLPASQDHKRIGNNDTGKNTGGMGAYAPAPIITEDLMNEIIQKIISPTLEALRKEGRRFVGCLYTGLMITNEGPKVVEFNCRFGDPETQVVLPVLNGDFLNLLYSAASGKIIKDTVKYSGGSSVCVVAASKGYPDHYEKGFEITGLENADPEIIIYHAGTREVNGKIFTHGGRVIGVTSVLKENNLLLAKEKAYKALGNINFEGIYFRTDISDRALSKI
jgi:phosphoribosylamine---glycine ligase